MRTTYHSLQYLRGLAALLVVVAHTTEYPITQAREIPGWTAKTAAIGVTTFFVISGFIINMVTGSGRFDPVVFAWRRFLRVAPLYWVCTCFLFAVTLIAPSLFKTTTADPTHFLQSLLFIPHPAPGDGSNYWSPLLKPGWTLNFEVFFYALVASLFWCGSRRLRAWLLTLILGALAVTAAVRTTSLGVLDFYASPNLLAFLAGIWIAEVTSGANPERRPAAAVWVAVSAAACLAVAAIYVFPATGWSANLRLLGAPLIVTAALLLEQANLMPRMAWLHAVGDASYSLYLTHMFTVGIGWTVFRKLVPLDSWPAQAAGVVLSMGLATLVALFSYRLIEVPFIRLSHRVGRPTRPAPAASAASPT